MKSVKTNAPTVQTMEEYLPKPYVDETDNGTYYGWAAMGTEEDEPAWRIMKETKDGTVTKRQYAQGTMDFVSAWSKRTEYNYSR